MEKKWKNKANFLQKLFKVSRNNLIGPRDDILSLNICKILKNFKKKNNNILDIGSGPHAIIAKKILKLYGKKIKTIDCYDFYDKKYIKEFNSKNKKIKIHNIKDLKTIKKKYDFALVLDVLHHIDLNNKSKINNLITLIFKKSKYLILKEHLQKNIFDKLLLIIMDIAGNIKDGVKSIPVYFDKKSFQKFIKSNNLQIIYFTSNIRYYYKYIVYFNKTDLHFISVLKKLR